MTLKQIGISENMMKFGEYLKPQFNFNFNSIRKSFIQLPWEDIIDDITVEEKPEQDLDLIIMAENTYTTNNLPLPFHMGFGDSNCTKFKAAGVGHSDILDEEWMFWVRDKFNVPGEEQLENYRKWVADVIIGKESENIDVVSSFDDILSVSSE